MIDQFPKAYYSIVDPAWVYGVKSEAVGREQESSSPIQSSEGHVQSMVESGAGSGEQLSDARRMRIRRATQQS